MNTYQVEQLEAIKKMTLFPPQSPTKNKSTEQFFSISVLDSPSVIIRAINPQQRKQIVANPLTERELCVLRMIVDGNSNLEISEKLYITIGTVKTHIRNIFNKLNVDDRTQATVLALRSGLVD